MTEYINAALRGYSRPDLTAQAGDDRGAYDVFLNGDSTPYTVINTDVDFEVVRETAPRCYQYVGSARTFVGLARLLAETIPKEDT